MIKSSQTLATTPVLGLSEPIAPRAYKSLRRAYSIESLSPRRPTLALFSAEYSDAAGFSVAHVSTLDLTGGGKQVKEKGAVVTKNISPTQFCSILTSTSSTQLDVEGLKKLRLLLRNEVAS